MSLDIVSLSTDGEHTRLKLMKNKLTKGLFFPSIFPIHFELMQKNIFDFACHTSMHITVVYLLF